MNLDKNKMFAVGKIASNLIEELKSYLKPGINGIQIDEFCENYLNAYGAKSAALNYHGFPKSICLSINEVVCHGIPNSKMIIKEGDIVSVDICCSKDGYYSDNCYTYIIGKPKLPIHAKLVNAAYESMTNSIKAIKPGVHVGTLGYIMESTAKKHGFYIVKDFAGHGIGLALHLDPQIPFHGVRNTGPQLKEGMYITIEPMLMQSYSRIKILKDEWTATCNSYSAQFERTILVTNTGYEIVTDYLFDNSYIV